MANPANPRRARALKFLCLGLALATAGVLPLREIQAASYHGALYGYNLTIPDDWINVPPEVVKVAAEAVTNPKSERTFVFDAAFQPASHEQWLDYPYVIVQVMPYASMGIFTQINEDEFAQVTKSMTGVDFGRAVDSALSSDARSFVSEARIESPQLDTGKRRFLLPITMSVAGSGKVAGFALATLGVSAL